MLCRNGHPNPDEAAFCSSCGDPLHATAPAHPVRQSKRALALVAALVMLVVVAGGIAFAVASRSADDQSQASAGRTESAAPTESVLRETALWYAHANCKNREGGQTLQLADEDLTLLVDTRAQYGPIEGLICVMGELETPQAIISAMESTTAMMGVQEATDASLHYRWSYHPDNGIQLVVTETPAEG